MTIRGPLYTNPPRVYWDVASTFSEIPSRIPPPNRPKNQTDWPLPTPPTRIDATWVWQGNVLTPKQSTNKPFNQYDWPVPTPTSRLDLTWNQPLFLGRIPAGNKPPQPTNYHWPLPVQPSLIEQTWTFNGTKYVSAAGKPRSQSDWPNPIQPVRSEAYTFVSAGLSGPSPKPLNNYDWPLPVQPSRLDATWIETGNAYYTVPPKPFSQTDWPLPVQPSTLGLTWSDGGNTLPPLPASGGPFNQHDWPLTPAYIPIDPTWIIEGIGGGISGTQPFNTLDWPLPGRYYTPDSTWINQGIRLAVPPLPRNTYDWPVPQAPYRIDATWLTTPVTIPPPIQGFNQYSWPLPVQPSRIDQTWVVPHTLILPPTPIPAGSNYDWPNPRDPRDYRTWTWSEYPGIIPPPNRPFNQSDWPVPGSYPRLDETYVWYFPEVNLAIPFSQHDWPLPGRYPTPDGTWINIQQIVPFVQSPLNQYDWPVPRGYPRPDGTWITPGIQQGTVIPMPLLTTRENVVYYPKFFSIDSIPPNITVFIPPFVPPPTPVGGGREDYRGDELERLQARWKRDYEEMVKHRPPSPDVDKAAAIMSSLGGHARAKSLTSKQRSAIASKAASIRWK